MSGNSDIMVRPMLVSDLDRALELSYNEGWNQIRADWEFLLNNPMNTCIVAHTRNRVIGTATALNHSNEVAWIGMVIVDRQFRGQGIGKMLLKEIIGMLAGVKSVKLDATPAGGPLYRKFGFVEERIIWRMTNPSALKSTIHSPGGQAVKIRKDNLDEILKLDRLYFGTERASLLKVLFDSYPTKAFMIRKNNKPEGYILGREGARFSYIGPLSASSTGSALSLLAKILDQISGQPAALDVLEDKTEFISWLESAGFIKQRHFIRMFLNSNPYPGQAENQYLISGPEFG